MLIFFAELFDRAITVELLGVDERAKAFFIAAIGQLYAGRIEKTEIFVR